MSWDVGAWVINTLKKLLETHGVQTFTSNGTFTVPAGVHKIWVTACGGGGGGAGADTDRIGAGGGGGGGGACVVRRPFSVTPGESISITIGSGGSKGASGSTAKNGGNGGSTVIGNLITLAGGKGGTNSLVSGDMGGFANPGGDGGGYGGGGGYWSGSNEYGTVPVPGSNGALGSGGGAITAVYIDKVDYPCLITETKGAGGGGGGSYGNGGCGGTDQIAPSAPGYGGGGGGASLTNTAATAGGKGIAIIEW